MPCFDRLWKVGSLPLFAFCRQSVLLSQGGLALVHVRLFVKRPGIRAPAGPPRACERRVVVSQTRELSICALTTTPERLAGDPQRSAACPPTHTADGRGAHTEAQPAFWKWRRWANRGWWLTLCKVVSSARAAPSWSGGLGVISL